MAEAGLPFDDFPINRSKNDARVLFSRGVRGCNYYELVDLREEMLKAESAPATNVKIVGETKLEHPMTKSVVELLAASVAKSGTTPSPAEIKKLRQFVQISEAFKTFSATIKKFKALHGETRKPVKDAPASSGTRVKATRDKRPVR
ncbi:hypothetical protein IZ6_20900 [Terrihabitans soli]|uniref:Uncharacterized protein n=2 Tax=Terrihabitans soli TaxID=708113 RepID=A0A6S6QUW1_9HYPH|nr:hypothetical protein IZ6_20900 [Terrihabitans soli]